MNDNTFKNFGTTLCFTLAGILIILIAIFFQLNDMNDTNKVNLTYKIYGDMQNWEQSHPEARKWIYESQDKDSIFLKKYYYKWDFDDYLGYYELLYSFEQKGVIDKKLSYDLFSGNLEGIYEENNFELQNIIDSFRIEANDPEIYIGVENLYHEYMKSRKTITAVHKTSPSK